MEVLLDSVRPGEVRTGTVAGFDGGDVILDLDGAPEPYRAAGLVPGYELSWRRAEDPADIVAPGQTVEAEVICVDRRRGQVVLSARACEDRTLRDFLLAHRPGEIVTGTVAEVHTFGVFVNLDGEPARTLTGYPGIGFIRVPEVSWLHIDDVADVVRVGQRVTAEVLSADTRQGQVAVSLKALQDDPFIRFAERVGEPVPGHVTKLVPFGVFIRVADGIEGLLPWSELPGTGEDTVRVGQPMTVTIVDVDLQHRRVTLSAPAQA